MEVKAYILLRKLKYISGETMQGQVIVDNQTTVVQRLKERMFILFHGYSTTNLRGRKVTNESSALVATNRRNSIGTEIYLQTVVYLTPEDSTSVELEPGQNGFPFSFELPSYLPSSFYGSMGVVSYEAKTTVSVISLLIGRQFSDTIKFRVTNCQDLNLSELAGRHSFFSFEKMVPTPSTSRRHTNFGLLSAEVKLQSQAFVAGESIPAIIQVNNLTGQGIEKVLVEFTRDTCYACPAGTAVETEVLNSWVQPYQRSQGNLFARMDVPQSAPPTSAEATSLISMKYSLTLSVQFHSDRSLLTVGKIPIFIGSIPLRPIENGRLSRSGSSNSQASTRSRQSLRNRRMELEGADVSRFYPPSAPSLQEIDSDGGDQEFPPSYLEAIAMPGSPAHQSTEVEDL